MGMVEDLEKAKKVIFLARPHNYFGYRSISVDGEQPIPLMHFFHGMGIGAKTLAPIFGGDPADDADFAKLGSFPLDRDYFIKLAVLLNKPVEVYRELGLGGGHTIFTVYPDGRFEKAA